MFVCALLAELYCFLCVNSTTSCIWITVPGRCSDQAQQSRQYSCCCLYATAGEYTERSQPLSQIPKMTMLNLIDAVI